MALGLEGGSEGGGGSQPRTLRRVGANVRGAGVGPSFPPMDLPGIRPRFEVPLSTSPEETIAAMRARLRDQFRPCSTSAGRCMELFVEESERSFWSPHLSVQLEEAESGSVLHARYAPHPEVWTMFVFLYSAFGFLALVGLGWAFAQYLLGRSLWGLLLTVGSLLAILALHQGARIGQRLTSGQMESLHERLDHLLEDLSEESV